MNKKELNTIIYYAVSFIHVENAKILFADTNYTLNDVRKKKLVKPVALTLLLGRLVMALVWGAVLGCFGDVLGMFWWCLWDVLVMLS